MTRLIRRPVGMKREMTEQQVDDLRRSFGHILHAPRSTPESVGRGWYPIVFKLLCALDGRLRQLPPVCVHCRRAEAEHPVVAAETLDVINTALMPKKSAVRIIEKGDVVCDEYVGAPPQVTQIKEKFGELVVYVGCRDPDVSRLIEEARATSRTTCEDCGAPGELRSVFGWMSTVCDDCALMRRAARMCEITEVNG